jgi:hypothetical protein
VHPRRGRSAGGDCQAEARAACAGALRSAKAGSLPRGAGFAACDGTVCTTACRGVGVRCHHWLTLTARHTTNSLLVHRMRHMCMLSNGSQAGDKCRLAHGAHELRARAGAAKKDGEAAAAAGGGRGRGVIVARGGRGQVCTSRQPAAILNAVCLSAEVMRPPV